MSEIHGGTLLDRLSLEETIRQSSDEVRLRLPTYVGEADFFHGLLAPDLDGLPEGSPLLEVGSGIGLLAMLMSTSGHPVIAFEPESAGFGQMRNMRDLILNHWRDQAPDVLWIDDFLAKDDTRLGSYSFEYAFAVNVVEHVPDLSDFFVAVMSVLRAGGRFRFICPNYSFPYEPHFEIPTLLNKSATYRLLRKRILSGPMLDPKGMWDELSWPTVGSLRTVLDTLGCRYAFSANATNAYLIRPLADPTFIRRKGPFWGRAFKVAARTLPGVIIHLPHNALPVIDCTVWAGEP